MSRSVGNSHARGLLRERSPAVLDHAGAVLATGSEAAAQSWNTGSAFTPVAHPRQVRLVFGPTAAE